MEEAHLKLWIEGEQEGLACAIKAVADFKGLRRQRPEHLEEQEQLFTVDSGSHFHIHWRVTISVLPHVD